MSGCGQAQAYTANPFKPTATIYGDLAPCFGSDAGQNGSFINHMRNTSRNSAQDFAPVVGGAFSSMTIT